MADERTMDALSRHWNAVARGEPVPPTDPADLDPVLTDVLAWAIAEDDAPGPDPGFVARLEETLMGTATHAITHQPSPRLLPNGRTTPPKRWSWLPALPVSK